jgi:arsenate reductase
MAADPPVIYHNPRCSKSRDALKLLQDAGVEVEVIEYLKTPPTAAQLRAILNRLGMKPEDLVRKGEATYKEHYAGKTLSNADWIAAMVEHPILIERPIFVKGDKAVVGRPPEIVLHVC